MSKPSPYHSYTAADIRRYLDGGMSPREMHDLERAALDDPFLADAIEGYRQVSPDVSGADMESLKERLRLRVEEKDARDFSWWRIAAIFVLVLGASMAAWYLMKPEVPENRLAKVEELRPVTEKKDTNAGPSIRVPRIIPDVETTVTAKRNIEVPAAPRKKAQPAASLPGRPAGPSASLASAEKIADSAKPGTAQGIASAPEKNNAAGRASEKKMVEDRITARTEDKEEQKASAAPGRAPAMAKGQTPTGYFRGRVHDAGNNPIPYASIRIGEGKKGTYTDLSGNFSILASDSILHVEIASVGYRTREMDMMAGKPANVGLDPSGQGLGEVVVSGKVKKPKNDSSTARGSGRIYAEPQDGWLLYEIYLANNLRHPSIQGTGTLKGSVTLSFYVDPESGDLYDFKVDKSLHPGYDKEAIRVLREGPAWEVINTDSRVRATYTVIF